jgi:CDGSH-type Zn-finger protein
VIVNGDGQQLADVNEVTLCRCGRSRSKPFCDGSHREGFESRQAREITAERERAESPGAFEPNRHVEPPASV